MDINALIISGSDQGAVPCGSTKIFLWGRNRIDGRVKTRPSPDWAPSEAQINIVANDNFAEGELMAA